MLTQAYLKQSASTASGTAIRLPATSSSARTPTTAPARRRVVLLYLRQGQPHRHRVPGRSLKLLLASPRTAARSGRNVRPPLRGAGAFRFGEIHARDLQSRVRGACASAKDINTGHLIFTVIGVAEQQRPQIAGRADHARQDAAPPRRHHQKLDPDTTRNASSATTPKTSSPKAQAEVPPRATSTLIARPQSAGPRPPPPRERSSTSPPPATDRGREALAGRELLSGIHKSPTASPSHRHRRLSPLLLAQIRVYPTSR